MIQQNRFSYSINYLLLPKPEKNYFSNTRNEELLSSALFTNILAFYLYQYCNVEVKTCKSFPLSFSYLTKMTWPSLVNWKALTSRLFKITKTHAVSLMQNLYVRLSVSHSFYPFNEYEAAGKFYIRRICFWNRKDRLSLKWALLNFLLVDIHDITCQNSQWRVISPLISSGKWLTSCKLLHNRYTN